MKLFKSLILSLIAVLISSNCLVFCDEKISLTPSGEVVALSFELKHPYIQQRLNENGKTLQVEDIILSIKYKNKTAKNIKQIYNIMKLPNEPIVVEFIHQGKTKIENITTEELRMYKFDDVIYGIGTITAIDKKGNFIGVAHSIELNKSDIEIKKGYVHEVSYIQEVKSHKGKVGNLVTSLTGKVIGKITDTNEYGIKGKYYKFNYKKKNELKTDNPKKGNAYILCKAPVTNQLKFHEIEIKNIGKNESEIVIMDKDLIKYRGGGVRGMSGSPIIQDNKIVGGFCSVFRKEPTKGYITNIYNMLTEN